MLPDYRIFFIFYCYYDNIILYSKTKNFKFEQKIVEFYLTHRSHISKTNKLIYQG